jgi:hypothetical protein
MRKYLLVAVMALLGTLTLAACGSNNDNNAEQQTTKAKVTKPTNPNDKAAWNQYLSQVLGNHMQGMTADQPYPYMVPAGSSSSAQANRARQLDNVTDVVQRGITPGNLIAFGGPNSSETADLMVSAFKHADPGSLKGVIVMFIGDKADNARVAKVVKPTDAKYRFVQM